MAPAGGIAFAILTMHAHAALMDAIRAKHENRRLSLHDPLTGLARGVEARVGITIGAALYAGDGAEADTLLMAADDALYEGKRLGKGRLLFAPPPPVLAVA